MHSHALPRATRRFGDHQRLSRAVTRRRRPLTRFHALDASSSDTCPLRMTSSSTTRFDPDRPGNLTRSEPPQKKKKKKVKEKKNALTKWTFDLDLDQKVKIFKTDLSHSIFRVHSDFGTRFFIRSSEIVQMSSFQKLTFAQMLTKK